jgi:hypothetical protein
MAHAAHSTEPKVYGLVAEFDDPDQLLEAATKAYKAGYRQMDAYSPFPIHGLSEAIGFKKCGVAPITLIGGLVGTATAWGMQYFASTIHYPYDIGGKPFNSWPSFVPIMFELTILFGAFAALGSMLILNGLPMHWHPIFNAKRFERASSDGSSCAWKARTASTTPARPSSSSASWVRSKSPKCLRKWSPTKTANTRCSLWAPSRESYAPAGPSPNEAGNMKKYMIGTRHLQTRLALRHAGLVLVCAMALLGCHQDMWDQPRYKTHAKNSFFADDSAARLPVGETVRYEGKRRAWASDIYNR